MFPEKFKFAKLNKKHKKWFIAYQVILYVVILLMALTSVLITNPDIVKPSDQISLTFGAILTLIVLVAVVSNRLKILFKIRFVAFLMLFLILLSFGIIYETLIWAVGLELIPLFIDDLIIIPKWRSVWYNNYEWQN